MLKIAVLISGSGSNLQAIIDAIDAGRLDAQIELVISSRHDVLGLDRAELAGIKTAVVCRDSYPCSATQNERILELLQQTDAEYIVMAGYMRLLGTNVLRAYPNRVVNLHPSLLPAFKGATAIKDAFEAGVKETGVSVHFANEVYDEGPIIAQCKVAINEGESLEDLERKIHAVEHKLLPETLQLIAQGRVSVVGNKIQIAKEDDQVDKRVIKRALVSVTNKDGVAEFCKTLQDEFGVEIISTGGTASTLSAAGVNVTPIDELTGFPEMMDGRVKTLHPRVHGGLLALRNNEEHQRQAKEQGIKMIDLVVVNLYDFEKTISGEDVTEAEAIENIDIGGPSMLRSAAKNFIDVAVVTNPKSYSYVLSEMRKNQGALTLDTRRDLAVSVFEMTSIYDRSIFKYLSGNKVAAQGGFTSLTEDLNIRLVQGKILRYGENPHQEAAVYNICGAPDHTLAGAKQIQGKELSYNNYLDTDGAWLAVQEFDEPTCVIVKHTNPCGIASRDDITEAYKYAFESDPVSAFGGVMAFNRTVTKSLIEAIQENRQFVEVMIAPSYEPEALELLAARPNLRVLETGGINRGNPQLEFRYIEGGALVQYEDEVVEDFSKFEVVSEAQPTPEQLEELYFAWRVAKTVKSNAIVLTADKATVGVGAGQMNRVMSAEVAATMAGTKAIGSVCGSDAFIPFPDTVETVAAAGAVAIIQPGGSVRDDEVLDRANDLGLIMVYTGHRHFRH